MGTFAHPAQKKIRLPAEAREHDRWAPAAAPIGRTIAELDAAVEPHAAAAALRTTSDHLTLSPRVQRLAQLKSAMNGRIRAGQAPATPARSAPRRPLDSARAPVQRYFRVDHNQLTAARGATFPSQAIVDGVPTRTTKTRVRGGQVRAVTSSYDSANRNWPAAPPVVAANQPPMNVSAGAELAIEATQAGAQATAFYSTAAIVNASNAALTNVGSPVRLAAAAHSITVPTNPDPNAFNAAPKTLFLTTPATHVPANHPSAEAGRILDTLFGVSNCDDVVDKIVRPGQRAVVAGTGGNRAPAPYQGFEPGDQIGDFVAAHSGTQNVAGLAAVASQPAAQPIDQAAQTNYQNEIQNHGEPDAALGLNRHAAPQVGEAFFISSLAHGNTVLRGTTSFSAGNTDVNDEYQAALQALAAVGAHVDIMQSAVTAAQKTLRGVWNNHYAGVIARDGADAVTMENYARAKERNWNILGTFNDLYRQFTEFRRFVRTQTQALASQDGDQLKALITSAQADSVNAASLVHGRRVELQQALQAVSQNTDTLDASMLHFKMYGPRLGQTFHEQFLGSTANALTMTLGTSLPSMVAHERTETQQVCNACIAALNLGTPNAAVNAALAQQRNAVHAVGVQRLTDLAGCGNIGDVMRVLEVGYLRNAYEACVERVRAQAAGIGGGPGLFAAPTNSATLQTDLDAAILNHSIGLDPRGRDARIQVKRDLQALKQVAVALHAIHIHE